MCCECFSESVRKAAISLSNALKNDSLLSDRFTYDDVDNTTQMLDDVEVKNNKEKYKNTIFLDRNSVNMRCDVTFHSVREDSSDRQRSNEWRNTSEKINKIKPYLAEKVYIFYGLFTLSVKRINNYLSKENIKLLMSQGWEFNNYDENAKE